MTIPDFIDKTVLFWEKRSVRSKAVIVITIGVILYIL